MAGIEVASVVASIISAFGHGMDVFRRMTGKKSKRKAREATSLEEEVWLRDSLERRPVQIRESYNRNVARLGPRFEIGDTLAHSSLAHTLLVLNAGLIKLINNALSNDSKTRDVSRRSLLNLSEVAAADTLNALSQLSLRLNSQPQLALPAPLTHRVAAEDQKPKTTKRGGEVKKQRPAPSPLLVRGGWVRPKSGSTVSSSSLGKSAKGTKHQRSKSEPAVPKVSKASHLHSHSHSHSKTQPVSPAINTLARHDHSNHHQSHDLPEPRRQPSMLVVSSDFFEYVGNDVQTPPPRPPKIPLHSRPNPNLRPRPPSAATFQTTSTKIGEIPDNRFADHVPSMNELRQTQRPQYTLPPMLEPENEPKKKGRGFRFWKKDDKREPIGAY